MMATQLEDTLRADGTSQIVLPALRENMSKWMVRAYGRRALIALEDDELLPMLELMGSDGLYEVLDGDVKLVRALAWISLNWRIHSPGELPVAFREAAKVHRAGEDLWAVVETIRSLTGERLGEEWVSVSEGRVHCLV
jgi:hypothetical protein